MEWSTQESWIYPLLSRPYPKFTPSFFPTFGKLAYHEVLRLAKEVFGNFANMHCFLEEMENTPSCTVETNTSELCSPEGSDTLTRSALSAQDGDEEEEDSGKHAAKDQHIFALGRNRILIFSAYLLPIPFMETSP